jgi:colanic acid/amylovoran biosynthesis protein
MGASFDTGNQGVSALAASLVGILSSLKPDARLSFFIGGKHMKKEEKIIGKRTIKYEIVNYRLSPKASLKEHIFFIFFMALIQRVLPLETLKMRIISRIPALKTINEANWVGDIRGGDSFSDIYGLSGFLMGSIPDAIVFLMKNRLVYLPQTYGPYRSPISKIVAKRLLSRSETILTRDKEGMDVVKELLRDCPQKIKIQFCPDVAFSMEGVVPNKPAIEPPIHLNLAGNPLVGFNISGLLYNGGFNRKNMFGLKFDYRNFVHVLTERILKTTKGRLLLVPHTFAPEGHIESDPDACREVWEKFKEQYPDRIHLVKNEYDQCEIKGIIGMCDFFIGSRMHACIAALSQCIPTVGVAYSPKFKGVFQSIGVEEMVLDARTIDMDKAIELIMVRIHNREKIGSILRTKVARVKIDIEKTFRTLLDLNSKVV